MQWAKKKKKKKGVTENITKQGTDIRPPQWVESPETGTLA